MITRIIKIIEDKKLTNTLFADKIQIQRSSLSHILSGRNNPSLDVIVKILNTFPEISPEWLIKGLGNPYVDTNNQSISDKPSVKEEERHDVLWNLEDVGIKTTKKVDNRAKKSTNTKNIPSNTKEISSIIVLFSDGTYDTFVK